MNPHVRDVWATGYYVVAHGPNLSHSFREHQSEWPVR